MLTFLYQSFITLLVVINPLSILPVFCSVTQNDSPNTRKQIAAKMCIIGLCVLVVFAIIGEWILDNLQISGPAFRIAGGCLLFLNAVIMVVGNVSSRTNEASINPDNKSLHSSAIFPLAIPMLAGPGSLTAVVVLMKQVPRDDFITNLAVVLLIALLVGIVYVIMRMSDFIMGIVGISAANVLTRVFGIILSALAMQNIISGILDVVKKM